MAELDDLHVRWGKLRDHVEAALQHIHDYAIVRIDPEGSIAGWNVGAERVLGYSEQDALGRPTDLFYTPEDRRAGVPQQELEHATQAGETKDERWHLHRDGSRVFCSGTLVAVRDDSGSLLGFLKIFRDLTEHPRAVEQLASSEARYRLLVDSIKDYAIFMLDADGCVSYWTRAAERIKGYTPDEIIGRPFATFFTEEDRNQGVPERELETAHRQGRVEASGWRVRNDGSLFWAEEIATAIHDATGKLVGYSKITRDTTERRHVELERERLLRDATETNRLKDEFLGTISHELRTPLNAILGWLQLLRLRTEVPASLSEGLAVIERNARTQGRLIEDLLDASRIVSGKATLTLAPIALAKPLAAAVETVKPEADREGIELQVRHNVAEDHISADAERLQQVIWNLLSNSIKFTPRGGRITVTTTGTPKHIQLCITDTGAGIEPGFLPFVFDRFRQADTAHSRQHGGLGLGLSIVKHLVELHDGRISIESAGPNRGTTVTVQLPRIPLAGDRAESMNTGPERTPAVRELTDVTLLVVDDDADSRRMLELVLTAQGADVSVAGSAREGLATARSLRPDVVLTDVAMPLEDGFLLLSQLRTDVTLRDIPVVAITAHARGEDRARCVRAGFDAYLAKPVDMNEIIDIVVRFTLDRRTMTGDSLS